MLDEEEVAGEEVRHARVALDSKAALQFSHVPDAESEPLPDDEDAPTRGSADVAEFGVHALDDGFVHFGVVEVVEAY